MQEFSSREKSRLKESYFAVNKDAPTVCQIVKEWDREHLSRWKYHCLVVRQLENFFFHLKVDNLEFRFPEVLEFLHNIGVRPHFTCPGHSSENGLAERAIGVVDTRERTFRIAENKPDDFWAFSWRLATQVMIVTFCFINIGVDGIWTRIIIILANLSAINA